tara:strand:+ start:629 stop:922 length:294 start_codon:yes stop_codon:yes gene_type:complete
VCIASSRKIFDDWKLLKVNGHNSQGSTWTEESKKRSKNNAIGGRSVNIGVDSLTATPVGNEGQRLNDWMQRRIAQTKNDGVNFTQRKGDDVLCPSKE